VDGNATFNGTCTINGGLVADNIDVSGILSTNYEGNRNVVLAKDGSITIRGKLYTEKALVFASWDIETDTQGNGNARLEIIVNGLMLAGNDIDLTDGQTSITYTYVPVEPADMGGPNEGGPIIICSVTE